ncbi:Cysteine-rich receptor-like protein kinase 2 [Striga hermonthica]|uniref:Cysteine-rich receptor-like protein kinase 2 n=1 Tax=Striga hermonthica TaxID=68872 RepID=A0A9N7MYZ4_STRHE|nr:Cysteine-rich receptor-like protein kinase 2 [Striga hermonthica]
MIKKACLWPGPFALIAILPVFLLTNRIRADPRTQTVLFTCGTQPEDNQTAFVPNFVAAMENISTQVRASGFGTASVGSGPNTNYGLAQCYGDLSLVDCVLCYAAARTLLPQCYPGNGGRVYLDGCFMRSENYTFFEEWAGPGDRAVCGNVTRMGTGFRDSARRAVEQAGSTAPGNNGFARARVGVPGFRNLSVYVLANCWRTIGEQACRACLANATESVLGCLPSTEGRALKTGCFVRYSDTDFLNPVAVIGSSRGRIIAIVVASVSAVAVLITGAYIGVYIWKNKVIEKKRKGDAHKLVKTLHDSSLNFKYSTLEKATGSFDPANKLGQGGFGTVYKGVLPDGREIAVKRLFFNNRHRAADFYNEVNIISSVEHKNLVRLLGCSCSGPESLLVYEFLSNQSLDRYIFDPIKGKTLNWEKRFDIIIGTAEGLVYLHENTNVRIIHRDIKASNILLDSRLRAKIADFGLARSFQGDKSHISTAIAGTLGYMAPEYLAHGQLTEKADVYSFGVLLFEIVTGRMNNRSKNSEYSDSLISIVWIHFQENLVEKLLDPNLMQHNYNNINIKREMLRVIHVGLLCTQEIPSLRPSMSKVLLMLVDKEELPPPSNPPFMDEKTMELNDSSGNTLLPLDCSNGDSVANMSHSSIYYPRQGQIGERGPVSDGRPGRSENGPGFRGSPAGRLWREE